MEDFVFTVAMLVRRCSSVSRIQFVKSSSSEGGKGESGVQLAEIVSLLSFVLHWPLCAKLPI